MVIIASFLQRCRAFGYGSKIIRVSNVYFIFIYFIYLFYFILFEMLCQLMFRMMMTECMRQEMPDSCRVVD